MKKIAILILIAAVCLSFFDDILSLFQRDQASPAVQIVEVPTVEEAYPFLMPPQSTLYQILRAQNVGSSVIREIVMAAKKYVDLGRLKPGTRFHLRYSDAAPLELIEINFRFSAVEKLNIKKADGLWFAEQIFEPIETRIATFSGVVSDTLWASAEKAQMDPALISELSEIFAWQVDFAREVRANDRWRLSVEQKFVNNEPIGWGLVLAAEYQNVDQLYTAFLFRENGEPKGYFAADGTSLRRMFLKSPVHFSRISSRFQRKRFHPVLKVHRPHLGVDYAAPRGTPVRAVGDGVVTLARWSGGGGNTIKIRHNSTYQTAYKHLSGFAKGIRNGTRVRQGQIIGTVGSTGLSTGPHLHFEFYQNGQIVDPLGRRFPAADPVAAQSLAQFKAEAELLRTSLPVWSELTENTSAELSSAGGG